MIIDEAVEAAKSAFYAQEKGSLEAMDDAIRKALEAAAPHMHARAWDEGYKASASDTMRFKDEILAPKTPNPYRSQA